VLGVMFGAMFGGFLLMMSRFQMVAVRDVRVVMALGVIAVLMGFRCFLMMSSCLFVMVRGLGVMVGKFLARHVPVLPLARHIARPRTIRPICDRRMNSVGFASARRERNSATSYAAPRRSIS
jgi:hypothetical protein